MAGPPSACWVPHGAAPVGIIPYSMGDMGTKCKSRQTVFLLSELDILCKANYTKFAKQTVHLSAVRRDLVKNNIRQLRKERKLSQEELALAVGTTRQTITSIEVERYTASLVLAYKIAHYFGRQIEEVFDFGEIDEKGR